MPLFKKIKAKAKNCRGGGNDLVLKQFEEHFSEWEKSMGEQEEECKEEIKNKFEGICEGLGEALLSDEAEYKMVKADMNANQIKEFCEALCPAYFELEDE